MHLKSGFIQDGAEFYAVDDDNGEAPAMLFDTYPHKVRDGDMTTADAAFHWLASRHPSAIGG